MEGETFNTRMLDGGKDCGENRVLLKRRQSKKRIENPNDDGESFTRNPQKGGGVSSAEVRRCWSIQNSDVTEGGTANKDPLKRKKKRLLGAYAYLDGLANQKLRERGLMSLHKIGEKGEGLIKKRESNSCIFGEKPRSRCRTRNWVSLNKGKKGYLLKKEDE